MTRVPLSTQRIDPYKNFKFSLKWDGRDVAGVSNMSSLKDSWDVVTFERGLTLDAEFERWAKGSGAKAALGQRVQDD